MIGFVLCDTCTKEQLAERLISVVSGFTPSNFNGFVTLGADIVVDPIDVPFSIITADKLWITNINDILHYTFSLKSEPRVKIVPRISKLDIVACVELPCQLNEIVAASRISYLSTSSGPVKLLV